MHFIILKVNGTDVSGKSQEEALETFRAAQEPISVEVVRQTVEPLAGPSMCITLPTYLFPFTNPDPSEPSTHPGNIELTDSGQEISVEDSTTGEDMAPKAKKEDKSNRKSFLWSGCVAVATQTEDGEYGMCTNVLQPWLQNCLPVGRKSDIALDDGFDCNQSVVSHGPSLDSGPMSELDFDSDTEDEVDNTGEYDDYDVEYEEIIFVRSGSPPQRLGIEMYSVERDGDMEDIFIDQVEPNSLAEQCARIRQGDQILQVNGVDVRTRVQIMDLFNLSQPEIVLLLARLVLRADKVYPLPPYIGDNFTPECQSFPTDGDHPVLKTIVDTDNQLLAIDPFGFENESYSGDNDMTPDCQYPSSAYVKPPVLQGCQSVDTISSNNTKSDHLTPEAVFRSSSSTDRGSKTTDNARFKSNSLRSWSATSTAHEELPEDPSVLELNEKMERVKLQCQSILDGGSGPISRNPPLSALCGSQFCRTIDTTPTQDDTRIKIKTPFYAGESCTETISGPSVNAKEAHHVPKLAEFMRKHQHDLQQLQLISQQLTNKEFLQEVALRSKQQAESREEQKHIKGLKEQLPMHCEQIPLPTQPQCQQPEVQSAERLEPKQSQSNHEKPPEHEIDVLITQPVSVVVDRSAVVETSTSAYSTLHSSPLADHVASTSQTMQLSAICSTSERTNNNNELQIPNDSVSVPAGLGKLPQSESIDSIANEICSPTTIEAPVAVVYNAPIDAVPLAPSTPSTAVTSTPFTAVPSLAATAQESALKELYIRYVQVMYTNEANLQHTISVQQKLFEQQLTEKQQELRRLKLANQQQQLRNNEKRARRRDAKLHEQSVIGSVYDNDHNEMNGESCGRGNLMRGDGERSGEELTEWVVKRRPDGSRYVMRRPVKQGHVKRSKGSCQKLNNLTRAREAVPIVGVTADAWTETCNLIHTPETDTVVQRGYETSDDETLKEHKTGRHGARHERRKHVDKVREYRRKCVAAAKHQAENSSPTRLRGVDRHLTTKHQAENFSPTRLRMEDRNLNTTYPIYDAIDPPAPRTQRYDKGSQRFDRGSQRFDKGSQRFDKGSQRFDKGSQRFDKGSQRFDKELLRFDKGIQRFDKGSQRFDKGSQRFDKGSQRFDKGSQRFDQGSQRFDIGSQKILPVCDEFTTTTGGRTSRDTKAHRVLVQDALELSMARASRDLRGQRVVPVYDVVELSRRKATRHGIGNVLDHFTTLQELMAHGTRGDDNLSHPLLSVTTV